VNRVKAQTTQRRSSAKIIAAVSALIVAGAAGGAQADTITVGNYTQIFQGISEATATVNGESAAVLQINLDSPGISFTTSPLCTGCTASNGADVVTKQTTGQFLVASGAAVAIDANQYTNNDGAPTPTPENGLQVSNGTLVNPDKSGFEALLISQSNQAVFATGGSVSSLAGIYNAIAGQQGLILSSGTNTNVTDNQSANRAGLGVSQNGQYMYLVDVSDVQIGSEANLLADLGAYNAINLNGGASAELDVSNGHGGATTLNNSGTKDVGADLAIYAEPLTPVPLPPALMLFSSGLLVLIASGRRRLSNLSGVTP
jgi:exopolysaccharide biosynthesis protein